MKVCFPGLFLDASDTSERLQQDGRSVSGFDGRLATEPLSVLLFFLCGNVKPGPGGETRQADPLKQTSDCWFQDASSVLVPPPPSRTQTRAGLLRASTKQATKRR